MSRTVAAQFLARIENDPFIRNQIMSLDTSSGFDALLDYAAYRGYFFSLEELVAASKEQYEQRMSVNSELARYYDLPQAA